MIRQLFGSRSTEAFQARSPERDKASLYPALLRLPENNGSQFEIFPLPGGRAIGNSGPFKRQDARHGE
jgi:hypothetical protein